MNSSVTDTLNASQETMPCLVTSYAIGLCETALFMLYAAFRVWQKPNQFFVYLTLGSVALALYYISKLAEIHSVDTASKIAFRLIAIYSYYFGWSAYITLIIHRFSCFKGICPYIKNAMLWGLWFITAVLAFLVPTMEIVRIFFSYVGVLMSPAIFISNAWYFIINYSVNLFIAVLVFRRKQSTGQFTNRVKELSKWLFVWLAVSFAIKLATNIIFAVFSAVNGDTPAEYAVCILPDIFIPFGFIAECIFQFFLSSIVNAGRI